MFEAKDSSVFFISKVDLNDDGNSYHPSDDCPWRILSDLKTINVQMLHHLRIDYSVRCFLKENAIT